MCRLKSGVVYAKFLLSDLLDIANTIIAITRMAKDNADRRYGPMVTASRGTCP